MPEDQALLVETAEGVALITGCGHAGIVNLVDDVRAMALPGPVFAVIGGLHLYEADDAALAWTARKLQKAGLRFLRAGAGLTRATAVYGGVGASFTLGKRIDPGVIGR